MNKDGAHSNGAVNEQCNYGNDIEQFGQLLATLLGNCHGSSEYNKVNKCHCFLGSVQSVGCRLRNAVFLREEIIFKVTTTKSRRSYTKLL